MPTPPEAAIEAAYVHGLEVPRDRRKTVSLLWLFAILNVLFRDVHELTMAGTIDEILSGYVNGNPMSEGVLLVGAFAVELLLLGFLLSRLLAPRTAKALNLFLAPLAIMGTFLGVPNDPDDYFFAFITISTFAAIFVICWTWHSAAESPPTPEAV